MEFIDEITARGAEGILASGLGDSKVMPSEESERIKAMLGAGQYGEQSKLSDIFQNSNNKNGGQNDALNAMRYLKIEIDDEVDNKNLMLKDQILDQGTDES